jgi:hypothetical protein
VCRRKIEMARNGKKECGRYKNERIVCKEGKLRWETSCYGVRADDVQPQVFLESAAETERNGDRQDSTIRAQRRKTPMNQMLIT